MDQREDSPCDLEGLTLLGNVATAIGTFDEPKRSESPLRSELAPGSFRRSSAIHDASQCIKRRIADLFGIELAHHAPGIRAQLVCNQHPEHAIFRIGQSEPIAQPRKRKLDAELDGFAYSDLRFGRCGFVARIVGEP